jgi:hypothetical protein
MKSRIVVFAIVLMISLTAFTFAQGGQQGGQRGQRGRPPAKPVPRTADGKVSFGPLPGELGVWLPGAGGAERLVDFEPGDATDAQFPIPAAAKFPGKITVGKVPFQPWARELYNYRRENQLEPHTRCKPSGGPRQFLTPYGVEFVINAEAQRVFIFDIGGPHTARTIYTDGRPHPKDLAPSYYGHSTGKWEGDTLVVDSVGFNESFWMDRYGFPHTEKLHMIERFTRQDSITMKYEVTIDDPGAYTAPWSSGFFLFWDTGQELFEYVCQENNFAGNLMVGAQESIDRTSQIVP